MTEELISIKELKDRFYRRIEWLEKDVHDQYSLGLFHGAEYDAKLIDEIPVVEVKPVVHAKWNYDGTCDNCKAQILSNHANFCPACGAKMDGE